MTYCGRASSSIENDQLRVTVLREGGHIAEILHKTSGVNPLWTPPWPSMEPSAFHDASAPVDAKLLAGIMGHNICLDIFGVPSPEEAAAGIGVHGEAPVAPYEIEMSGGSLVMRALLPLAEIRFERTIELRGSAVAIAEVVESLAAFDRPIGWTQHVTLGPPFLECGITQFEFAATRARSFETAFGADDRMTPGHEFAPQAYTFSDAPRFSNYTANLMDPANPQASFRAWNPRLGLAFSCEWNRADFPWLGIWEENRSRLHAPWNGETVACGMEFGASPFPETRRQMVDRGPLFGAPGYRWLSARGRLESRYSFEIR